MITPLFCLYCFFLLFFLYETVIAAYVPINKKYKKYESEIEMFD